ncbi:MAG: DUF2891 family protein [Planctomycetota bacterium]
MNENTRSTAHRDAVLLRLGVSIREAVERRDTKHPLFKGCIDWHSSVHGHWALLRIANVTGRGEDLAEAALKSLFDEGLAAERSDLASRPHFEMPYGRAWFLRLTLEFEARLREDGDHDRLRPMADEISASLVDYHTHRPAYVETMEYVNDAWSLCQLHAYGRATGNEPAVAQSDRQVKRRFLGEGPAVDFSQDGERPEFFSRFGNWVHLVARTQDSETLESFLERHPIRDEHLTPIQNLLDPAHHLGMNWSRAWALKALSSAAPLPGDRIRFLEAYERHVEVGLEHHEEHKDRYGAYGHWVPQFAVYALTE